ncbi:MAG: DNA starvation/stationary phase protection protein [Verrucomicrobiales bacterium]|nr:DNA starvation/stationary phase protection protein [Verrucomicrobiales bacterium]
MTTDIKIAENISNGLTKEDQKNVIEVLVSVLADQHVLYVKLRNFHWNLKGARFHSLHEFFEQQYTALEKAIDETAERIRMLGGVAPGSMSEFLSAATLKEAAGNIIDGDDAISSLVTDNETVIRFLREKSGMVEDDFNDVATADFLVELLQKHEQDAWMLRSFSEIS